MGIFPAFLIWAGTRPNEGAAFQWKDILDWEKGTVRIERNIVRLKGRWEIGTPKTEAGIRTFTLPPSFMSWLKEHRQVQLQDRLKAGGYWQDHGFVFTNEIGEPLTTTEMRNLWQSVLAAARLPEERRRMRVYDSRHSMATLLLLERVPTKVVGARLGHKSEKVTSDIYQHVLESMQEQATEDLERAIYGRKSSNKP
jgi:integrase